MNDFQLIEIIRKCAYNVRLDFCPGYLESVYKNALLVLLREEGLHAEKEQELTLCYHGNIIGEFRADIIVNNRIILELKAVSDLKSIHEMQLVNYLNVSNLEAGVLINYGSDKYCFLPKFRTIEQLEQYRKFRATNVL